MCRLFAYVSPIAASVEAEMGQTGLASLLALSQVHGDGWGWASTATPGTEPRVHKSAKSAANDEEFAATLAIPARAAMVHLRWATLGLEVATDNTHPFLVQAIAFEHNGSLKPIGRIREMITADSLATLHGQTDSEMYFALIRENLAAGSTLGEATRDAVARIRDAYPVSSLNAMILSADELVVVHAHALSALDADDLEELRTYDLPDEHADDYFALRWTTKPDGTVLIGSTGVAGADWTDLPPETIVSIQLSTGAVTLQAITQ